MITVGLLVIILGCALMADATQRSLGTSFPTLGEKLAHQVLCIGTALCLVGAILATIEHIAS